MSTQIISGFPGIGKSTIKPLNGIKILDLDGEEFAKYCDYGCNYDYYMNELLRQKYESEEYDYILVSSHKEIRDGMKAINLPYTVVVPDPKLKDEYIKRYYERGSSLDFIKKLSHNWEEWISEIILNEENVVVLDEGQFLSDVIAQI